MKARSIASVDLDSYQRAARLILTHHLVTTTFPDRSALSSLRRWATELREDLLATFGYRLEVTETTARLFTVADRLDPGAGTSTATDRSFDRRRYAYLALAIAALGRGGGQITLSELADHVASDAGRVEGVDLDTERAADRDAFVDAVAWLTARGALALADGDAGGWASDPGRGEALYDIDRAVVAAVFRPPRALQHLTSVRALLGSSVPHGDTGEVRRRVRRALVQKPVVYAEELSDDEALQLALPRTTDEVELLTGLVCERRAEGVALVDTSGRLSDVRFPNTGTVAQVALLLAGEICDRVLDPDAPAPERMPLPAGGHDALAAAIDGAIPRSGLFTPLASAMPGEFVDRFEGASERPATHPLIEDSWIAGTIGRLVHTYGRTFAAQWQADPAGLAQAATERLEQMRLVVRTPGGVLALPALARFRGVTVSVRKRDPEIELFPDLSLPDDPPPSGPALSDPDLSSTSASTVPDSIDTEIS
ncbi:TIGR02678 family protein [Rhodococcus artemisiae]|uniref:TIGR02678 family protein n=1 Tax=Rhodococcus artemisiae TaxID=714159 RepID=A0ABU7L377_9NOCA|nr:TIGR02678 family protein [Rhodococcus artemisiae]MEE2056004.1 TIGR02678 family protein [Rhodococcus artemisiae]